MAPVRLVIFDATQRGRWLLPSLSFIWAVGARLYRRLGWIDHFKSARTWNEALRWAAEIAPGAPLGEIQIWAHGKWGAARMQREELNLASLTDDHLHHDYLRRIRARLLPDAQSLWWFRTCETLGAEPGQRFAAALAQFLNCRVAGHTYRIGFFQSGLHCVAPGEIPDWPTSEGLRAGTPADPQRAHGSRPWRANTIICLQHALPKPDSRAKTPRRKDFS